MIRLCINSQTPPARPLSRSGASRKGTWRRGIDYEPQAGGVVPMMQALLRTGQGRWISPHPRWVALGAPGLPKEIATDEGYLMETVSLPEAERAAYGRFKERVWRSFHGPGFPEFISEEYRAFVRYSNKTADALLTHLGNYDLFYINDFQQILVGGLIGSAAPTLLHWHIPMEFRGYPEPVRRFFLKGMEGFDAILVSTRSGLEELIHSGFHGRAFQIYPFLDPEEQARAPPGEVRRLEERFELGDDPLVLSVSRLDPVKRQDLLIEAYVRVRRKFPRARLLLVGGGSFTTENLGGPGGDKAQNWEEKIRRLIRSHHIPERLILAGRLSARELRAAYDRASVFVHPAPWEGFGLVVIEAWLHGCPVIVSRHAGVAELVNDDVNGYSVPPGSVHHLSDRILQLLRHPEAAERMGAAGALTARACQVQRADGRLREILETTIRLYERAGLVGTHRIRNH